MYILKSQQIIRQTEKAKWENICANEGASTQSGRYVKEHIVALSHPTIQSLIRCIHIDEGVAQIQATCCVWVRLLLRGGDSQKQEVRRNEIGQTWSVLLSDILFPFSSNDFPGAFSELDKRVIPILKSLRRTKWHHSTMEASRLICDLEHKGPWRDSGCIKTATSSGGASASWTHRW